MTCKLKGDALVVSKFSFLTIAIYLIYDIVI